MQCMSTIAKAKPFTLFNTVHVGTLGRLNKSLREGVESFASIPCSHGLRSCIKLPLAQACRTPPDPTCPTPLLCPCPTPPPCCNKTTARFRSAQPLVRNGYGIIRTSLVLGMGVHVHCTDLTQHL